MLFLTWLSAHSAGKQTKVQIKKQFAQLISCFVTAISLAIPRRRAAEPTEITDNRNSFQHNLTLLQSLKFTSMPIKKQRSLYVQDLKSLINIGGMAQLAALMFVNFRCKRGDNAMERISLLTTEPQLTDFKNV